MSLLNEMKANSGLSLKESDISQEKQMNAESRLIGAFGRLISELRWIKTDCEKKGMPGMGHGMMHRSATEQEFESKTVDKEALYKIAEEKLKIVGKVIEETFEKAEKKEAEKEDEDDDDEDEDGEEED